MCPIPFITFNWSTIRLSFGPPLENIVWIIMVYRASVFLLSLAYVICSRSCMAPSTEYPPSADPVMHSFISLPLILSDPAEGLTCYEHGCSTALARNKPLPFLEEAALHWCAMQSAWTGCWWSHLVPLLLAYMSSPLLEMLASVPHYPLNGRWGYCARIAGALRNTPIICSIVCHQLQVKYTFLYIIGWTFLILFTWTLLSPQDDGRHTQKERTAARDSSSIKIM